ncbi:MAG TPA: tetratricopeptide repeat protein, partial [Gemmataceae bacterium]
MSRTPAMFVRMAIVTGVLGAAGAGIAWWQFGSPPPLDPPMPVGVQETEIVRLFERHRVEVLAKRDDANTWGDYAQVLLAHLFSDEAKICFVEAARLAPQEPRWRYGQAQLALKLDPPLAEELLRQTIATTGPGEEFRVAARLVLGELLVEGGDIDRAAEFFEAEYTPSNGSARAAYGLGLVAMARKDAPAAERYFSLLLKNPYSRKQAHIYLARLARMKGDDAGAQKFATDAAALTEDLAWPDPLLDHTMHLAVGRRSRDRRIFENEKAGNFDEALQLCLAELN